MKIVLNGCYGGFGLSYEAMYLYLTVKGEKVYFYADLSTYNDDGKNHMYKRVPLNEIYNYKNALFIICTTEDQGDVLCNYPKSIFHASDVDRSDPILVFVVETMGSNAASGKYASLYVEDIPDGTQYKIDNYDGIEELITKDDDDWKTAVSKCCVSDVTSYDVESAWQFIKSQSAPDSDLAFKH